MTDTPDLDRFERDLAAVAVQRAPAAPDPAVLQRRLRGAFWRPLRGAHIVALIAAAFALDGEWIYVAIFLGVMAIRWAGEVLAEREALTRLESGEALLERARKDAKDWLRHLRTNVVFFAACALFAAAWSWPSERGTLWLVISAICGGIAAYEALVLLPMAGRAYRDTGATEALGWFASVLVVLLMPLALVALLALPLRLLWQKLRPTRNQRDGGPR